MHILLLSFSLRFSVVNPQTFPLVVFRKYLQVLQIPNAQELLAFCNATSTWINGSGESQPFFSSINNA